MSFSRVIFFFSRYDTNEIREQIEKKRIWFRGRYREFYNLEVKFKGMYWDYIVSPSQLLDKIDGRTAWTDERERNRVFVRTFETLKWNQTVEIWSIEQCLKCFENSEIEKSIRRQQRARFNYLRDFLHGKTVSPPGQNFECYKRIVPLFVSDRWYGVK